MSDCEQCAALQRQNDLLANDRDGYVQSLTDQNNKLRAEVERQKEWNHEIALNAREFASENEKLRAVLESIMVGGNSLAQIIGADHPPHGTPYGEALAHYGSGVKYEAWCCWNSIMKARAVLEASDD